MSPIERGQKVLIQRRDLDQLFQVLQQHGYTVVGPQRRDGAIVYDTLESSADLPAGWTDEQDAGTYRIVQREDEALFGYRPGPSSWKRFMFPPELTLWRAVRNGRSFDIEHGNARQPRLALLGVRACELHAIAIQDRVFGGGPYGDAVYRTRRSQSFVIAVPCAQAGGTCFCVSMKTGPEVREGFDLSLTELLRDGRHEFVAEAGSERGAEILAEVTHRPATPADAEAAARVPEQAASKMGRTMPVDGLPELLAKNPESARWSQVAERCLSCANCTMSCPTCFCHTVEDVTDLTGTNADRVRRWDSCFSAEFSFIHGGSVRPTIRSRYRQWLTHKLSSWHDQFGTSGCVGCGRCITWCPARIDITEEVRAIQEDRRRKEERRANA
jgi:formate hydrogenlyase subunit 6/NADH:ubiquinone oxidoreductase subunit I